MSAPIGTRHPNGEVKWCSYCKKNNHNDSECHCTRAIPFPRVRLANFDPVTGPASWVTDWLKVSSKPVETVDTCEFRIKLADLFDAGDRGEDAYSSARTLLIDHINAHAKQVAAEAIAPLKRQNLELARVNAQQRLQEQRLEIALVRANKLGVR